MQIKNLDDLKTYISEDNYQNAYEKYSEEALLKLVKKSDTFYGEVLDEDEYVYFPIIVMNENSEIIESKCHCKESNDGPCIHQIVVLIGILNDDFVEKHNKLAHMDEHYKELIDSLSHQELKEFILDYADNSNFFTHVSEIYFNCESSEQKKQIMDLANKIYESIEEMIDIDIDVEYGESDEDFEFEEDFYDKDPENKKPLKS